MIKLLNLFPRQSSTLLAGATLLALAAVTPLLPSNKIKADVAGNGNPFTLAGTWQYQIPLGGGAFFTAYETFNNAGGSVEINNGPGGPTTGIGTWTRIGPRQFLATLHKQQFDSAGAFIGSFKVRRVITIGPDGNELTGLGPIDLLDPDGNVVDTLPPGDGFTGTRLLPEPVSP